LNRFRHVLSLVALSALIGCGGGTGTNEAPPSVPKAEGPATKETGKAPEGKKAGTNGPLSVEDGRKPS